ncbi:YceG family protein [Priestia aryabhattai]|uniref:YceG family protein n=1 Tax=Priestia aryabhattai TaxID=412384 RepID=UPI00238051F1|nr:YceG family protein [Priestia aryabhattai]WDW06594.1 YceG family protein [Priestia aryabhattai]
MSKLIDPHMINLNEEDGTSLFSRDVSLRGDFIQNEQQTSYKQVAGRYLGTHLDADEYADFLYELAHSSPSIIVLHDKLDKSISNDRLKEVQTILKINQEERGLSVNRLFAFLEGKKLIVKSENPAIHRRVREKFIETLTCFKEQHAEGFMDGHFQRVLIDLIKWQWNHVKPWMVDKAFPEHAPRIMWYGDANKSEQYFLHYLILLGFDVLTFHPEGKDHLKEVDKNQHLTTVYTFPSTSSLVPFPTDKPVRKGTVAFRASQEIEQVLHSEESMLYKPWQFRSYFPTSVTLKTTYDEIFLLMRERAFIRPNFEVSKPYVHVPVLFSKVLGISKNRKEYWSKVHELMQTEDELALTIDSVPFAEKIEGNNHFHYQGALGSDGTLSPDRMIESNWWRYKELPIGLQKGLAAAISRYCAHPKLLRLDHEDAYQHQMYLFNQSLKLPNNVLRMLQKFDYTQHVPRLIIYHGNEREAFTREDAALLLLLNEFGVDIVLFNPTGQLDIEAFVKEKYFDMHWLEDISFNEEFKEPSLIQKWLKRIF